MKFISKTEETVFVSNLSEFCKENQLDLSAMHKVNRGERKSHKGYRKFTETKETELRLEILELKNLISPIIKEREKAKQRQENESPNRIRFGSKKD